MRIAINGTAGEFDRPVSVRDALRALVPGLLPGTLGCFQEGAVAELGSVLHEDAELSTIGYDQEEGRRIYERSLRFVFLAAVRRRYPSAFVRIEHSIGQGVYVELDGQRVTQAELSAIDSEMRAIIEEDLPFTRHQWRRQQAIAYFSAHGDADKARLLSYRPYDHFNIYECDGMYEYFYGAMLPSTGYTPVFALHLRTPGLIILLPDRKDPSRPAPYLSAPTRPLRPALLVRCSAAAPRPI